MQDAQYALQSYWTGNLGDEIQSIAARQFLPTVDLLVDRDRLNDLPANASGPYRIILNGWHTRRPASWPPSPALEPLLVSMHFTNEINPINYSRRRPSEALLEGDNLEYLQSHGPVGARDLWTLKLLQEKGVDAYFSGCVTLTLGSGVPASPRGDYICAADLPDASLEALRARTRDRIVPTTHGDFAPGPFADQVRHAERLLSLYAQAKCVVTSRLHCALPCLALGTPVLLVLSARDAYRFEGLKDLLHHCSPQDFLEGANGFDVSAPPQNGDGYRTYREALIRRLTAFVGAESDTVPHPFVPSTDIENLIAIEQSFARHEAVVRDTGRTFRSAFRPGLDYSDYRRPDFLRDLAKVHQTLGDLEEAKRLLELVLKERPNATGTRQQLDKVLQALARREET